MVITLESLWFARVQAVRSALCTMMMREEVEEGLLSCDLYVKS
jgi:hypothetical protein